MPSPARRFEKRASLDNLVERVDAQRPGEITGDTVPTGFGSLDKLLGGGFRRRDLILLGGDVGRGAAIAIFLLPVLIVLAILMLRSSRRAEVV